MKTLIPYKATPLTISKAHSVSKIFALVLKGNMNLRKSKMALLPYRQGFNTCHIKSSTKIKFM
jgi:hypothetical protein